MKMSDAKAGKYKVVDVYSGWKAKQRLAALGIYPDVELEVISNQFVCPMMIQVKGAEYAIGKGLAEKVTVERI